MESGNKKKRDPRLAKKLQKFLQRACRMVMASKSPEDGEEFFDEKEKHHKTNCVIMFTKKDIAISLVVSFLPSISLFTDDLKITMIMFNL